MKMVQQICEFLCPASGVALVVNTRLLSAPADGWTVRLSRMVQGFGSFHSGSASQPDTSTTIGH
jgi:hypothetical protein